MKKIIVFLIIIFVIFSLISCGETIKDDSGKTVTSGYAVTEMSVSGSSSDSGQDALKKDLNKYKFNDYESVRYEDVVWTAMSEKMPKREYKEFSEYLPALTGEIAVHWQAEADGDDAYKEDGVQGHDLTVQQMFDIVREDFEMEDPSYGEVSSILFWDMTGDGVKELVMETPYGAYSHLIIHRQGNEFYGSAYVRRWFQTPQRSGYFWVGKGVGYWCYLTFKDEKYDIISVAGIQQGTKGNSADILEEYYIQDKRVNEKEYKEWEKENLTGEIKEYELPVKEEVKYE